MAMLRLNVEARPASATDRAITRARCGVGAASSRNARSAPVASRRWRRMISRIRSGRARAASAHAYARRAAWPASGSIDAPEDAGLFSTSPREEDPLDMESRLRRSSFVALGLLACAATVSAIADTVLRRDGSRFEGSVRSVDDSVVFLETSSGPMRFSRGDVASIVFASIKPVRVEVRNVRSDDSVDVLVDGVEVIRDARDGGEWIEITPRLKEGNTALRLRIHNDRGGWAYHVNVRLNGTVVPISCGTPLSAGHGCKENGKTGDELGTIDDLPEIWIHVDRALGRAEILP